MGFLFRMLQMITIEDFYSIFLKNPVISTDTRKITPGSIFLALKGRNFNGNHFIRKAFEQGAAYAVSDEHGACKDIERCFCVEDVLEFLQKLAKHHRKRFSIPVVGITGTNGKTTTKELIFNVLSQKFATLATAGNLNNHIGVPLTLLNITKETQMAVIEMGANHPGEIEDLCQIALPGFGLITNIGKAHLEGFGSIECVMETKSALYRHIAAQNGEVFVNSDNHLLMKLASDQAVIKYGTTKEADDRFSLIDCDPYLSLQWIRNEDILIKTHLTGSYNLENVMAAVCIGRYFNVEPGKIKLAIESYFPRNNRSQLIQTEYNEIIVDCYNANPSSMALAIKSFYDSSGDNKVLVIGDMFELGKEADSEHKIILDLLLKLNFRKVILLGDEFCKVNHGIGFPCFRETRDAAEWLKVNPQKNAKIMLKGSRGMKMEELLPFL